MKHYVYKLYFKDSPNEVYIGQTNNLQRRYQAHIKESFTGHNNKNKAKWIRHGLYRGQALQIDVLVECTATNVNLFEQQLIAQYLADMDYVLYNVAHTKRDIKTIEEADEFFEVMQSRLPSPATL